MILKFNLIPILVDDWDDFVQEVHKGVAVECEVSHATIPPSQLEGWHVSSSVDEKLQRLATFTSCLWIQIFETCVYLIMDY